MDVLAAVVVTVVAISAGLWCFCWLFGLAFGFGPGEAARVALVLTCSLLGIGTVIGGVVIFLALVWSGVS